MARWGTTLVVIALIAISCGSGDEPAAGSSSEPVELECELGGYPCSLTEVSDDIIARSDILGDDVLAMFRDGATRDEVDAFLEGQPDMAEVESDELAVWFRVEGGRGNWVLRSGALGSRSSPGSASSTASAPAVASQPAPALHVTGEPREAKSALVLSPMLWDFKASDEGEKVAAMLGGTRGYGNGVTFKKNATIDATEVGIEDFRGWGAFDVVHVVSHGARICEKSPCRAAIAASTLVGDAPSGKGVVIKDLDLPPERGLEIAKAEDLDRGLVLTVPLIFLTADFFRDAYNGGLDEKVIFFSACETFGEQATDLGDAIRGQTSVFFGWSEIVNSASAHDTALLLYENLAERGYPAHEAWEEVGVLRIDPIDGGQLMIGDRPDNDDLHIRDVVELLDPTTGEVLSRSSSIPIIGTREDGEPDDIPYAVRVDGMLPEFAPEVILHLAVDGVEIDPQPITNGEVNEKDQWTVTGTAPLGFDLEEDTPVNLRAWVELYTGGESDDETPAEVVGGPIMGLEWQMEARSILNLEGGPRLENRATLTLEFEDGQEFDEPFPRYVVTGGTVTYEERNNEMLGCTYSAPEKTFTISSRMSPANRTDGFASSALIFDTTKDPIEYHGIIYTEGSADVVTQFCPDNDDSDTDTSTVNYGRSVSWMIVDQSEHRTLESRTQFGGADQHAANHLITWELTRIR